MNMEGCIRRINELYHKEKASGLTPAEKEEQQFLRKRYIDSIRQNIRGQLDQINIQNADGSIENLGEKQRRKNRDEGNNDHGSDDPGTTKQN